MIYRSFSGYFDYDDIQILSWTHINSPITFIKHTFNFETLRTSELYRPVGALAFSICYQLFGPNFFAFHLVANLIHLFNLFGLYLLIQKIVPEKHCALLGCFVFAFHIATLEIYWFFYIYDLLCASFLILSFLLYIKSSRTYNFYFLMSFVCFIFAVRSKEMAFTFPAILTLYELLVHRNSGEAKISIKEVCLMNWPFYTITFLCAIPKLDAYKYVDNGYPYLLHFSLSSISESIRFYLASVLTIDNILPTISLLLMVFFAVLPAIFKSTTLIFAYLFVLISLIPVLPLTTHRTEYYLYVPFIGISIYAAELYRCLHNAFIKFRPGFSLLLKFLVLVVCIFYVVQNLEKKAEKENHFLDIAETNRLFMHLVQSLHPSSGATVLFDSVPKAFNENVLLAFIRINFHDWEMKASIVKQCKESVLNDMNKNTLCVSYSNKAVLYGRPPNHSPTLPGEQ